MCILVAIVIVCAVALVAIFYALFVMSGDMAQREEDEQGIRRS